jgi:RNA polymerase sigma-70 factor (ECF subfamily)
MDRFSDAETIARSLREPEIFAEIFERHFDRIHAYLARRVGPDIGRDLTSEAFLAAFRSRHRYDSNRHSALPWLLGIATNLAHRHWRTERQHLASIAKIETDHIAEAGEDAIVNRVDAAAVADVVGRAVASLDAGCRDVLLLIAWADLSYLEVAEALRIPIGTVRSRLSRARQAVRQRLAVSPLFPDLMHRLETGADHG